MKNHEHISQYLYNSAFWMGHDGTNCLALGLIFFFAFFICSCRILENMQWNGHGMPWQTFSFFEWLFGSLLGRSTTPLRLDWCLLTQPRNQMLQTCHAGILLSWFPPRPTEFRISIVLNCKVVQLPMIENGHVGNWYFIQVPLLCVR